MVSPKPDKPQPDWERIEADYVAGVLSLREIAGAHHITEGAIRKRAKRDGWERDIAGKIQARADALVRRDLVRSEVRANRVLVERELIEANAEYIARVRGEHRSDIKRLRDRVKLMMDELEDACEPDLWASIRALAAPPLIDATPEERAKQDQRTESLIDALNRATGFSGRLAGLRVLADTLKTLIGLEREALGMNDKSAGGGESGRILSDVERAARLMSILDRAKRAKAEADARAVASAAIATAKG